MIAVRAALASVVVVCAAASAQTPAVARVSNVTGTVSISSGGSAAFALTRGYLLNPGDQVDTRLGGRAVIDLSDGSMVIVQPGTLLSIKDYRAAANVRELFEIAIGAVRVKIHHLTGKPNPYRMNSPTASIAVRGTEFNVIVSPDRETKVEVFEGAVEVGSLANPGDAALIEAGGAVLVRPGQPLQFLGAGIARVGAPRQGERVQIAQAQRAIPLPELTLVRPPDPERREMIPRFVTAPVREMAPLQTGSIVAQAPGAFERYISGLTSVDYLPLMNRFTAFADAQFDSFENPAYASGFRSAQGRLLLVPAHSNTVIGASEYALMPQASYFQPVGDRFVVGGGVSTAHLGSADGAATAFSSMTAVASARFGRTSAGFSMDRIGGSGQSTVTQLRFTLGVLRDLGQGHKAGVFYRRGTLDASPVRLLAIPNSSRDNAANGDTSEAGVRVRGPLARNLFYGASASVGILNVRQTYASGLPGYSRRVSAAFGVGYIPNRRTMLSLDATAGSARTEDQFAAVRDAFGGNRFFSVHGSAQRDITRRLWVIGSAMQMWRPVGGPALHSFQFAGSAAHAVVSMPPVFTRSSTPGASSQWGEAGAGWRFTRTLAFQYLFSAGSSGYRPTQTVVLRFDFQREH